MQQQVSIYYRDGTGLGGFLYGKNCNSDAAVVAGAKNV
jgi:hypothetical protein